MASYPIALRHVRAPLPRRGGVLMHLGQDSDGALTARLFARASVRWSVPPIAQGAPCGAAAYQSRWHLWIRAARQRSSVATTAIPPPSPTNRRVSSPTRAQYCGRRNGATRGPRLANGTRDRLADRVSHAPRVLRGEPFQRAAQGDPRVVGVRPSLGLLIGQPCEGSTHPVHGAAVAIHIAHGGAYTEAPPPLGSGARCAVQCACGGYSHAGMSNSCMSPATLS
jgi:hypothetical protein